MERYIVRKSQHIGPWNRQIRQNSILEWSPEQERLRIDGVLVEDPSSRLSEGMRVLKVLFDQSPETAPVVPLEGRIEEKVSGGLETKTLCVLPVLGCINAAIQYSEGILGIQSELAGTTEKQREFLQLYEDLIDSVDKIGDLESRAGQDVVIFNRWFAERGIDISLSPVDDGDFAVASILDVELEWANAGTRTLITDTGGNSNLGVFMKDSIVSQVPSVHPHPVVRVPAKNGDVVCMSMIDGLPCDDDSGIFIKVASLSKVKARSHLFDGASFPMINLAYDPDISWLNGLGVNAAHSITSASQHTKFQMNQYGARVQSAAAAQLRRSLKSSAPPYIIDRPFLLWIERPGLEFPLFAAVLCEDVWDEPSGASL